ncbi:TetR family transcriptional regulator [Rubrivivax sp. RP6-9]|uniref:TetR family transcriptional regulator n=1 Tax=Rubrivivax sp. RP6-9 TaxID=3415750 RepID=UPI003CC6076A
MARKTKEEALVTRARILDAAEHLFQQQGVSGTSLQDIASAAGVTRGAVYWHFHDKGDLFNAMMDRVCLPMETESTQRLDRADDPAPLTTLRDHLLGVLSGLASDAQLQRVFEIATHKIEYVDELTAVRERHLQIRNDYTDALERTLRAAQRRGHVLRAPSARHMAIGLHALLNGLIQNWMLDPQGFDLLPVGRLAIESFLAGLAQPQRPAD